MPQMNIPTVANATSATVF